MVVSNAPTADFLPLAWLDESGDIESLSSSSCTAEWEVRGGRGVGWANRGRAVELITSMRKERRRAYGVIKSLLSTALRSSAIAGVDGRPGAKKRGRGRGGNAGVGVNITEGAGDDCATESACGDLDSVRLADARVAVEGKWG